MATWTILAAGMTLVIVSGNIDLSVGSLLALVVGTCAFLIAPEEGLGLPAGFAILIALGLGTLVGLWQGFLVSYFRIPAFIVTLAGMFMFTGCAGGAKKYCSVVLWRSAYTCGRQRTTVDKIARVGSCDTATRSRFMSNR